MKYRMLVIGLLVLLTVSPSAFDYWRVDNNGFTGAPPFFQQLTSIPTLSFEQLSFGNHSDCIEYKNESVRIGNCTWPDEPAEWQSGENWQVKEAISADLNRDGRNELVMVVWRPHQPWPIDQFLPHGGRIDSFHDRRGLSCHIILVGWDGDEYRELWAGSSMIDPVFHLSAVDVDGDGNQELIAIEGKYDTPNLVGSLTVWDWSGFGFRLRDRLARPISEYGIISDGQDVYIVSN